MSSWLVNQIEASFVKTRANALVLSPIDPLLCLAAFWRRSIKQLLFGLAALASISAFAQVTNTNSQVTISHDLLTHKEAVEFLKSMANKDQLFLANGYLTIRDAGPSAFLKRPGTIITNIPKGSLLQVKKTERIATLFSEQKWSQIDIFSPEQSKPVLEGVWVYSGELNDGTPYLKPVDNSFVAQGLTNTNSYLWKTYGRSLPHFTTSNSTNSPIKQ